MISLSSLCLLSLAPTLLPQSDEKPQWPQFLGQGGQPRVGALPSGIDFDAEKSLRWRVKTPAGSSSPCIFGDRIFLTGHDGKQLLMLAYDRATGKELWRHAVESPEMVPVAHVDADPAAPTPCTDGERVVFYFGAYGLIVRDLAGKLLWEKRLPIPDASFGIGTSPILLDGRIILSRDGCPDSGVYAFDAETGEEIWSNSRQGFTFSFGTPFVWRNKERQELVVAGTQRLSGLDPKTGEELWHIPDLTTFVCTTPTATPDELYFAAWSTSDADQGERNAAGLIGVEFAPDEIGNGEKMFARLDTNDDGEITREELPECRVKDAFVYLDRSGDDVLQPEELIPMFEMAKGRGNNLMLAISPGGTGDVSESHVRWKYKRGLPYVASPLLHEGRIYLLKAGGMVTCVDAATGKAHYDRERLGDRSEYYATPVGVPGYVIVGSSHGTIYVLKSGDELEVVRTVELGEGLFATPAIVDGGIYVRSTGSLWSFGS